MSKTNFSHEGEKMQKPLKKISRCVISRLKVQKDLKKY